MLLNDIRILFCGCLLSLYIMVLLMFVGFIMFLKFVSKGFRWEGCNLFLVKMRVFGLILKDFLDFVWEYVLDSDIFWELLRGDNDVEMLVVFLFGWMVVVKCWGVKCGLLVVLESIVEILDLFVRILLWNGILKFMFLVLICYFVIFKVLLDIDMWFERLFC